MSAPRPSPSRAPVAAAEPDLQPAIDAITRDGYVLLPAVFEPERIAATLERVRHWYDQTKDRLADVVPYLNTDQTMVYNLQNKDHGFLEMLFASRTLERLLVHFLNDEWFKQIPAGEPNYILRSFMGRSSNAPLPMHIDSYIPYPGPRVICMQALILLEDTMVANGCTIVVPGSHLTGEYVDQGQAADALPVEGKAGDVILFDARLWHGATANTTGRSRWALVATFCRWWMKQAFNMTQNLPQHIYAKLTTRQKSVLGFSSIPWDNETEGIDMKRADDTLREQSSDYREHGPYDPFA